MRAEKCALRADALRKKYGSLLAVDGVSFELGVGECFALLGPNGAGKTTTCEMLEGLSEPDSGAVHLAGLNFKEHRQAILEQIGVHLQETTLYKKYTVRETLALFASFYQKSLPIEALLERLGLAEKKNSRLEQLSGGQKQRVYLGCALVNNPSLIFLDEPTSGLDPQARRLIWDLLHELKHEGRSIFLTTHYMEEAAYLADRIAIMDKGRIIAQGSLQELLDQHCVEEVLAFSTSAKEKSQLAGELSWLGSPPSFQEEGRYEFLVADAAHALQALIRTADRLQVKLSALHLRQSTLEDVFLKLTGRSLRDA